MEPTDLHPYDHYRFTKPRKNGGSLLVLIADVFITGNPLTDKIVLYDIREYATVEKRVFTPVLVSDFIHLHDEKKVIEKWEWKG